MAQRGNGSVQGKRSCGSNIKKYQTTFSAKQPS
jgi:hypothetical protein